MSVNWGLSEPTDSRSKPARIAFLEGGYYAAVVEGGCYAEDVFDLGMADDEAATLTKEEPSGWFTWMLVHRGTSTEGAESWETTDPVCEGTIYTADRGTLEDAQRRVLKVWNALKDELLPSVQALI